MKKDILEAELQPILKEVIDIHGKRVIIDQNNQKLYSYSNKEKWIEYNAQIFEHGQPTSFFTNYRTEGVVKSLSDRLNVWNNLVLGAYGSFVGFNASKNDPEQKLWEQIIAYVSSYPQLFYDENGDWKNDLLVSEKDIQRMLLDNVEDVLLGKIDGVNELIEDDFEL